MKMRRILRRILSWVVAIIFTYISVRGLYGLICFGDSGLDYFWFILLIAVGSWISIIKRWD